jgi:hypothetical protein
MTLKSQAGLKKIPGSIEKDQPGKNFLPLLSEIGPNTMQAGV